MKKVFLTLVALIGFGISANAQIGQISLPINDKIKYIGDKYVIGDAHTVRKITEDFNCYKGCQEDFSGYGAGSYGCFNSSENDYEKSPYYLWNELIGRNVIYIAKCEYYPELQFCKITCERDGGIWTYEFFTNNKIVFYY